MSIKYIPTGNEYVSLPELNQETGEIHSISFLSMKRKGMLLITGLEDQPFIKPFITGDASNLTFTDYSLEKYWIPTLNGSFENGVFNMTVLTPLEEKGFILRFKFKAHSDLNISTGLDITFGNIINCINESKPLRGKSFCYKSPWNDNLIFDFDCGGPEFSFAPMTNFPCSTSFTESTISITDSRTGITDSKNIIKARLSTDLKLRADEEQELVFYFGLGYEEVSAATSAKEMLRQSYQTELDRTASWLSNRIIEMKSPKLSRIFNQNLFFCIFYSTGLTFDTEERILTTSRSPRYYVSAAYWDRDSMLWSFPAILDVDPVLAREALTHVFRRQSQNIGTHSRYINGSILEPGFELDELVAPVIALYNYIKKTNDQDFLQKPFVKDSIDLIIRKLGSRRDYKTRLYSTFLQPTDDEINYPYLCYDNVLVWKALNCLSELYPEKASTLSPEAMLLKESILKNFTFTDKDGNSYFGWSIDLKGNHDIYDEPPGSLQLLNYYGFCESDDQTWLNTVRMIRSKDYKYSFSNSPIAEIGCPHAPYPWVLSLCNSLLCGYADKALKELELLEMDNGIACESIDPNDGHSMTGDAFATCAGFLCHSILVSQKGDTNR
jgi:meiotically up-regulated gene 157 (Mug157) protein